MKKVISVLLAAIFALTAAAVPASAKNTRAETNYTIISPYADVNWDTWDYYKANLHTHSTASDGDVPLEDMVGLYYDNGYDILAMTDHGVITNGWTNPVKTNGIFNSFRKVAPMSEKRYQEITTGVGRGGRGMVDITGGIEVNMAVISKTHVNGFFTPYGQGEWGKENDYATAPMAIEALGGLSVLNHVGDWLNSNRYPERAHWPVFIKYFADIFTACKSCVGMEIINSTDRVTRADRALWDELLKVVIPTGRNIWGFANDDSEQADEVGRSFEYFVLPENTAENVRAGMENGNFFACGIYARTEIGEDFTGTGEVPLVSRIDVDQQANTISLTLDESRDCSAVEWVYDNKIIATGTSIDLNDYEDELGCYIRFQLKGEGGITYSQAFELQYEGRIDEPIPEVSPFWSSAFGQLFLKIYRTIPFALTSFIVEKVGIKISEMIAK